MNIIIKNISLFKDNMVLPKNPFPPLPVHELSQKYSLSEDCVKCMNELIQSRFIYLEQIVMSQETEEEFLAICEKKMDKYMMDRYPDLNNRLSQLALDLKDHLNEIKKQIEYIEKRLLNYEG